MPPIDTYSPPLKVAPPPYPSALPTPPVAAKWTGTLPDKFIAVLVELVSQQNLESRVSDLTSFHTRHSLSTQIDQVANWLVGRFQGFGYTDVSLFAYTRQGTTLHNVVCTKPAAGTGGEVIIVGAHYDCIMQNHGDATARAPGADDNASGVAALLEIARLLQDVDLEDTVRFVAFSGEEQGLWGSSAYAAHVAASNVDLRVLINLDMVGYPPSAGTVTVEEDLGNAVSSNDAASKAFANVMSQMAVDYTNLPVKRAGIYSSDYMPFEADGAVVIGAFDGEGNPNYHNASDTPDTLDYAYLADVTRMTLATILDTSLATVDETASPIDLFIRDSPADTGSQPSPVPHWHSPDIWVRNDPPPGDDPTQGHQAPINNQPNYLYVRVHNRGTQSAPANTCSVETFRCDPGTGMIWPDHFQSLGTLPVGQDIPPAGSATVGPYVWTPQIVDHECLLAIATSQQDHPVPHVYSGRLNHGLLVRYDNNVGQRNVSPRMSVPGGKTKVAMVVRGGRSRTTNVLRLDAAALPADTTIELRVPRRIVDGAESVSGVVSVTSNSIWSRLVMAGGEVMEVGAFPLSPDDLVSATMTVDFSFQAEHLARYPIVMSQEQDGHSAGRLTVEITAVKEYEDFVFGNPRSRELHVVTCPFWEFISASHKIPFETVSEGRARGYDGCAFCLPDADTG